MNDIKILSFEECYDADYGNTVVQFQAGDVISFAFSSVDIREALKNPGLLVADVKEQFQMEPEMQGEIVRSLWSDLSEDLRGVVLANPFDMHFVEYDDPDWDAEKAESLWDESCRLGLGDVVTYGENDCYVTVFAGAIGSINWSGHPVYGKPCFEHSANSLDAMILSAANQAGNVRADDAATPQMDPDR